MSAEDGVQPRRFRFSKRLKLPRPLELEFWARDDTKNRILHHDRWALATGMLLNTALARFVLDGSRRSNVSWAKTFPLMAFLLQCVQLVWTCVRPYLNAYQRHRLSITLLQRAIRMLQQLVGAFIIPLDTSFPSLLQGGRINQDGWRPFLIALLLYPALGLLNAVNHPLPFELQTAFIAFKVTIDFPIYIPSISASLKKLGHQGRAESACYWLDSTIGLLGNMMHSEPVTGQSRICQLYASEFVMTFSYLAMGVLLPLHLTYWVELGCKKAYVMEVYDQDQLLQEQEEFQLEGEGGNQGQRQAIKLPSTSTAVVVMHVVISVAIAWWLCILYAPIALQLQ